LVLRRARIEKSVSHGARGLRGRFATAWSFNLERRFIGADIFERMNPGAGNRVQAEQLKGASLADGSRRCRPAARLDVHFADDTTAEVGLNNYVYTLKKL
jgi:hypothetical protein